MAIKLRTWRVALLAGCATMALGAALPAAASAEGPARQFSITAQDLDSALKAFAMTSGHDVVFDPGLVAGHTTAGVTGAMSDEEALRTLLAGANLAFEQTPSGGFVVRAPRFQSAADQQAGGSDGTVQALIVTAQKREEDIQDVPIAISAFTQEDLTRSQVAGGPDLITQVPNMTFTKTNFSSYSVQLRGIGTQAISATTDPAVAVAFNNTPFIRNRFFEQEFYDLQRVEVLRGPQGTLYGRNATAGVVNLISQKPKFSYEARLSADVGNFSSSRLEGMVNVPLVEDKVALRIAGAWTKRDGYATNQLSGNPIDGRDLWSTRVSLRVQPTDRLNMNLIWEHFQEDDDRLRSGKQLCKKDVVTDVLAGGTGPGGVGVDVTNIPYFTVIYGTGQSGLWSGAQATLSQGCQRNSLYAADSFQTPTGLMLPYYAPLHAIGLPAALNDPYISTVQSPDLRVIESTIDPTYRADSDIGELQASFDLTDSLTLTSETAYATDSVYSLQDFNRFNTASGAWGVSNGFDPYDLNDVNNLSTAYLTGVIDESGVFCDPQLGCSDRLVAVDISTAKSRQFSQELRLSSDFGGAFNFSLGANFLRADSEDKYYVFINSISLIAAVNNSYTLGQYQPNVTTGTDCLFSGPLYADPSGAYSVTGCVYTDPNPIASVNDQGHNYFLSKNPYKLISYAVFGEAYYKITDALKITAGLRWTVDKKEAPKVPTWILGSDSYGYPVAEVIEQEWREPTGRLAVDWKPDLGFTDETLLYASYAHGYKAGGANPPGFVRVYYSDPTVAKISVSESATRPSTFDAEFVNAFELGAKNTLLDGRLTLNLASFYYDYKGYQISEIVDRSAYNRNFDATVWGVELEADWRPLENLRLGVKGGYEKTRIADGEQAIDLMDRTAGDPGWVVVRPFPVYASSCILPSWLFAHEAGGPPGGGAVPNLYGLGSVGSGLPGGCEMAYFGGLDPVTGLQYTPFPTTYGAPQSSLGNWPAGTYPGWDPSTAPNGGEGIMKPLGGNELPNAPHWTATVTGDYTLPLANSWLMTLHTDVHWQSQSWWRVFNDHVYDKLHPYFTMNLAAIFTNEDAGWNIMAYIKNVTDETAITGAFLNSDDTGLTTNVFLTEPRLYGLRVTKNWSGGPLLGNFGARHEGPYPFTVELGGQVQRYDAPNAIFSPTFESNFSAPLQLFQAPQSDDLDWGDGREARITYHPISSPWGVYLAGRTGETNKTSEAYGEEAVHSCGFPTQAMCDFYATDPQYGPIANVSQDNWARSTISDREDHDIVDVGVERDVSFGYLSDSKLSLALRYASLNSDTAADMMGIPNWDMPMGFFLMPPYQGTYTRYEATFDARRDFKGAGAVVGWEASIPVLGGKDSGSFDIDWSLGGGALYGTTRTSVSETGAAKDYAIGRYALIKFSNNPSGPVSTVEAAPLNFYRTDKVTVPTASASLGVSYRIDGFRLGAGYRWERYFDAIDGGIDQRDMQDRTFDGPYLKLSMGFGG